MSYDTIIIGAGITGLTTAWEMTREGKRVILLERENRVGGVIRTEKTDGYLLEMGPNSFSSSPANIMDLINEVGLGDRVYARPMRDHDRFIWKKGKLRKVPMGPGELVTTDVLSLGEKLRAVRGVMGKFEPPARDIEIGAFFRQRIGDAPVDTLLKPFFAGIYAADADRASFEATFNKLFVAAQQTPSILKALKHMKGERAPGPRPKRSLVSFPDGLKELPERIAEKIREAGGEIRLGVKPRLLPGSNGPWTVELEGTGETVTGERLICTGPAWEAGALMRDFQPELSQILHGVDYAALTVVHIGIKESRLKEQRNGFGFLSVAGQGVDLLGMIWSDRLFPHRAPDGHRLMTVFYGGEKDPRANAWDEATLRRHLVADLKTTMGFEGGEPDFLRVTRWNKALPIFRVGHLGRMKDALAKLPQGITLLGNYLGGVSIPDRVQSAMNAAHGTSPG